MSHACRTVFVVAAIVLFAALQPARAAGLDAVMFDAATKAQPAVVESLKEMVAIESGSSNAAGLARMADYTEKRLQALGAQTERIKATRGPGSLVKGTFSGDGTRRVMLIAHMDTVYPDNTLASQPIRQDGNRLYGPGIADDKSGIAVILHALQILRERGWRDYAVLTVLFNPDEEVGSPGSGELIASLADQHGHVLSFEPTGAKAVSRSEGVTLGASATATIVLEVTGRSPHAGAAPQLGRNALIELSHQLLQTRDVAKGMTGVQLNWTTAQAGIVRNQIPERAVATGDVRFSVPGGAETLLAALQQKVASGSLVPDTTSRVTLLPGRPPFVAGEPAHALARRAQAIYAELDGRPLRLSEMTGGATDAGFAARSGKAVVLEGLGLAGAGYHARDEYIELDSIVPRLYLLTRLLTGL